MIKNSSSSTGSGKRKRCCNVCDDPQHSGAPVSCARCHVVYYCSKKHKSDDAQRHHPLCKSLATLIKRRNDQKRGLRQEIEDHRGRLWAFYEARDYIRTRKLILDVYVSMGTRDSLEMALDEALDLLHSSRSDPMGVRDLIPTLYLRVGKMQECYDFIKWWTLAFDNEEYSFQNIGAPFLDLHCVDMTEPAALELVQRMSFHHLIAFVHIQMVIQRKLWEAIQADRVGAYKGQPNPVVRSIQRFLGCPETAIATASVKEVHASVQRHITAGIRRASKISGPFWTAMTHPAETTISSKFDSSDEALVDLWLPLLKDLVGLKQAVRECAM